MFNVSSGPSSVQSDEPTPEDREAPFTPGLSDFADMAEWYAQRKDLDPTEAELDAEFIRRCEAEDAARSAA